MEEWVENEIEI